MLDADGVFSHINKKLRGKYCFLAKKISLALVHFDRSDDYLKLKKEAH